MTKMVDTTQPLNGFTTTAKEVDMQDETIVHAINHAFAAIGALTYEYQPTALATPDAIITLVQLLTRQPGNDDLTTAAGFARVNCRPIGATDFRRNGATGKCRIRGSNGG